ncbi:hypothetical protein [Gulosibacter sediminis]|uniref:hypothetical protein n=1 Tax=Gulosibacter sediminis TaxID=1729695 RepID=UPI001867C730|nr:hypothetical protein [Gulosibacter sediminis]
MLGQRIQFGADRLRVVLEEELDEVGAQADIGRIGAHRIPYYLDELVPRRIAHTRGVWAAELRGNGAAHGVHKNPTRPGCMNTKLRAKLMQFNIPVVPWHLCARPAAGSLPNT